jgi:LmbE family N-acetylglucosaminyl deacetylase
MKKASRIAALVLALTSVLASARVETTAQVRPVNDYGALGIARLLNKINTTASVMMVGAHPDDEDSSLLAYLARGENARTAYLSLTRGDGGQNIIGPELFESLGVIRTEELLQARRLDGAEQYFARAFDYGFSKSLAEAQQKWDEKVLLCDVVRGIRAFRPLVVLSRFSGTPSDGHGQHQFAGYITPLAVKAAADPQQCRESGPAWQVRKFYKGIGTQPTLRINTAKFDPILGRGYAEIAIEGRSLHRSQGEGRIEPRGEQISNLTLVESTAAKSANEASIFDGIDTSLGGASATFARETGSVSDYTKESLSKAAAAASKARSEFDVYAPEKVLPLLVDGREVLNQLAFSYITSSGPPERIAAAAKRRQNEADIAGVVGNQLEYFTEAIRKIIGLQIDALSDAETVVPGESISVTTRVYFPKSNEVSVKKIEMRTPPEWKSTTLPEPAEQPTTPGGRREVSNGTARFQVDVPVGAKPTQPYWLTASRKGDLFEWPASPSVTRPFDFPQIAADVWLTIAGKDIIFSQPVEYRFADPARGEVRREVNVVPRVSVEVSPKLLVIAQSGKPQTKRITLRVTGNSAKPLTGTTDLKLPEGWTVKQPFGIFQTGRKGESTSFVYDLTIPANAKPGSRPIEASVRFGEEQLSETMVVIAYPHIQTHRYYTKAVAAAEVMDVKVSPVRLGYVMGSGDDVPEAMRQLGLDVTPLEDEDIASGDLSRFDTIVVGIRASETRPVLASNFKRLTDYMNAGGTVIMQYQRGNFAQSGLTPYPVTTADPQRTAAGSIARVVDENAPVKILEPAHPIFDTPNKITNSDFEGWVQERNAYNLVTFDAKYTPLLESHDAGEQENKGGLVIAPVGKGNYIYASYSFFRQLPAGVPGAYRLFANMISLPKARK